MKRKLFTATIFLTILMILPAPATGQTQDDQQKNKQVAIFQKNQIKHQEEEQKLLVDEAKAREEQKRLEHEYFIGNTKNSHLVYYNHNTGVNNSFSLTNTLRDNTRIKEYRFSVDTGSVYIKISVSVSCQKGFINIDIYTPDGKIFNEFEYSDDENSAWSQSFRINNANEKERKKYTGTWLFQIETKEATGKYHISITAS